MLLLQSGKIKQALICLIVFLLPIYINLTFIFIDIWVILWLIEGDYRKKLAMGIHYKYLLVLLSYFLLQIIGLFYALNKPAAHFDLHLKYPILLFPFLLAYEGKMDIKKQNLLIELFVAGCIVNGAICLVRALWRFFVLGISEFQYIKFSYLLHPGYLSMYMDVAILLIFYLLINAETIFAKREKVLLYFSIIFLGFIILLLQSKMGLSIFLLVMIIQLIRFGLITGNRYKAIMIFTTTVVVYFLTYEFILSPSKSRAIESVNSIFQNKNDLNSIESTQVRYNIWHSALEIIKVSPFKGVGTGCADTALVKQYAIDGLTGAHLERLNAHNEYLEYAISLGIPGVLALAACLFYPLLICYKEKRITYFLFILVIGINILTESMFERLEGTSFYGLFNGLLMFNIMI